MLGSFAVSYKKSDVMSTVAMDFYDPISDQLSKVDEVCSRHLLPLLLLLLLPLLLLLLLPVIPPSPRALYTSPHNPHPPPSSTRNSLEDLQIR